MPSRGVGRAASQRRAFARDTIPLWVYASGSPIIHRRNRRSVRRLIWPSAPSLLAMAQPQPLSCCHRFGQASIQASASYSFMERTSLCHSGRRPAARIRESEGGHESEKSQRGHRVRQPTSTQFKALRLDTKYENPHHEAVSEGSHGKNCGTRIAQSLYILYRMFCRWTAHPGKPPTRLGGEGRHGELR